MNHYRPFRSIPLARCATSALPVLLIYATAFSVPTRTAGAQTGLSITAPLPVGEAKRLGSEAFDRKDYSSALGWYRKAADQGDTEAELQLGRLYFKGVGAPRDYAKAFMWSRRAADKGNADAQGLVGLMYQQGLGVSHDDAEALAWLLKCAEQGNAEIQSTVGLMYVFGAGTPKDYGRAMHWFQKAAAQNFPAAQMHIGSLSQDGLGVPKDNLEAALWYKKAAAQGYAEAQKKLDALNQQKVATAPRKISPALVASCTIEAGPEVLYDALKPGKAQDEWNARYRACVRSTWKRLFGTEPPE